MAATEKSSVRPLCRRCHNYADSVVVYPPSGDILVICHMCSHDALGGTGREYPLEEYYRPVSGEVVEFEPRGAREFDLYDPDDSQQSWISADNAAAPFSSVSLEEMV